MKSKYSFLYILLFALAFSSACTRKQEEGKKLTLKLPQSLRAPQSKVGSRSAISVRHIVINVHNTASGGGIKTLWQWDACHGPCEAASMNYPPDVVILDVPKGGQSLVQFMGAGQNADGVMSFVYDDEVVDLSRTVALVSLYPQVIGGTSARMGSIEGRYLTGPNQGPTGHLNIYLKPPGGRPRMLIQEDYIFGGFFNSFYVDGGFFEYYIPEHGIAPFGSTPFSMSNFSAAGLTHLAKLEIPSFYRDRDGQREPDGDETSLYGFFGPGVTGSEKVCYPSSPNMSGVYADTSTSATISWDPVAPILTGYMGVTEGGTSTCSGTDFVDKLTLNIDRIGNNGARQLFGFKGPYKNFQTGNSSHNYNHSNAVHHREVSSNTKIEWKYLPGVLSGGGITGSTVFYDLDTIYSADEFRGMSDGMPCNDLSDYGFEKVYIPHTASPNDEVDLPITTAQFASALVIVCPTRDEGGVHKYFDAGVEVYNSSGGGGPQPPTQLQIVMEPNAKRNTCVPFQVNFLDASNSITWPTSPTNVVFSSNVGTLYPNSTCSSTTLSSQDLSTSGNVFYIKTPANDDTINVTVQAASLSDGTDVLNVAGVDVAPTHSGILGRNLFSEADCIPYLVYGLETGHITNNPSAPVNVNLVTNSLGEFYSNGDCTGLLTPSTPGYTSIPTGSTFSYVYFKPNNISTVQSGNLDFTIGANTTSFPVTINPAGAPASLYVYESGVPSYLVDECLQVFVELRDASYGIAENASPVTVTITSDNTTDVQFFVGVSAAANCGTGASAASSVDVVINTGQYSSSQAGSPNAVYMRRHTNTGDFQLSATASGLNSNSKTITISP